MIERMKKAKGVHIYNLGTGVGYSVLDVVKAYEKACGKEIPYEIKPRRAGDIATCYCDAAKAKEELGWVAERGIEEMCEDSWRWQSANPDGYRSIEKQEIGLEADVRIDTEDIYHHTYQEEVKTMDYIREGNLEEVVGAVELLASTAGKLSENEIRNERNLGICSITLATRAAIEGGAAPAKAYKLSDRSWRDNFSFSV